jgi:UDP-N-acetylmuramoyl-L-alanyl-D-glutamate--2,6-diaminopimelate ligase
MGRIAGVHCSRVILTNEDPYDEDPEAIVREMHKGIADRSKVEVIMDRRKAIRVALGEAPDDSVVFVTGKGTDPYIMGPHGMKEKWDDATIVREEMERLFGSSL